MASFLHMPLCAAATAQPCSDDVNKSGNKNIDSITSTCKTKQPKNSATKNEHTLHSFSTQEHGIERKFFAAADAADAADAAAAKKKMMMMLMLLMLLPLLLLLPSKTGAASCA